MLKEYLKPYNKEIISTVLVKGTGTILEVVLPTILALIIDIIIPTRDFFRILLWGGIMVVLAFLGWIFSIKANRMSASLSTSIVFNLRQDLFSKSLNLSSRQIDEVSTSSLESRLTSDTYTIHRLIGTSLRMGVRASLIFLGGIFFCVILSPRLSLILIILAIPIFLIIRRVFNKGLVLFREVQNRLDNMVQIIRESIRGIRVIKSYNKVEYEKDRYRAVNEYYKESEIEASDTMTVLRPLVNSILFTGLAIILVVGAVLVNMDIIKLGVIIAFLSYFIQITNALLAINRMFNIYSRGMASWNRIENVLSLEEDKNKIERDKPLEIPQADPDIPDIEFRNVSFSYLGQKNNLEDISFKVYPGKTLGIIGATGSGKSTIIRLLYRFYDVDQGQILIRGKNIEDISISELKSLYGSAFQDDFLYVDTIRENIEFGRDISDSDIRQAASYAQALEFISNKEDELDFELASKGVNLSGGQKQRLILTRALASDPDILVLDDSTSALDFKTESKFRQVLRDEFKDTTKIIVAQRIASVAEADQILYLDKGKVLALASHEELLETCKPYREIAEMQMGKEQDTYD